MSIIELGCRLNYQVDSSTSFIFQVSVFDSAHQKITAESLSTYPETHIQTCQVGQIGHRMHRLVAQPGMLTLDYTATVSNQPNVVRSSELQACEHSNLPGDVLSYLNPSRYCESDKFQRFAWNTFGGYPSGHERVQAVADWVNQQLNYTPGSTGPTTTACDVFIQRDGVCRDFAHLMIAICRALGIPARYVAGYAVDLMPPDFHGFVEVFLDGAWYLFDATRLAPVNGFVRIGAGRDAADLSFATYVGDATMQQIDVWARQTDSTAASNSGNGGTGSGTSNEFAVSLG